MKIKGTNKDDDLRGTSEDDRILGRGGNDLIIGKGSEDRLKGGRGHDDLRGKSGNDVITGEDGDDELRGDGGDDKLKGGDGDDMLRGGNRDDVLRGDDGDDALRGDKGSDKLRGGDGADHFIYTSLRHGGDTIKDFSLDEGDELILSGQLSGAPIQMVVDGADTLVRVSVDGAATFETIAVLPDFLPPADDVPGVTIAGTNGDDDLEGTPGNDTISGRIGADTIDGGAGNDVLNGGTARFAVDPNDGSDTIHGAGGNDAVHGGNDDDMLFGGAGRDYLNGGLGGNDRVDGEFGDDRINGGFRGPGDTPGTAIDQDVLIGGPGHDIFGSRFWIRTDGWDGMDTTTLGGNVDLVADFVRGVDKIDAVIYRQAPGRFEFHQGGFEAFDTNSDGRLDDQDLFVTVEPVAFEGDTEESITLDIGEANLAAGRLDPSEVESGPHTLTIWEQSILDADDFIPTVSYVGLFSSGNGTAENDWIGQRPANSRIDGHAGNDLLTGGGGRDIFTSTYTDTEQPGADRISDFLRGEDLLNGTFDLGPGGPSGNLSFAALDANANGVLDADDDAVRIVEATAYEPGIAPRVGISTAIDLDVAYGLSSTWTGDNSITIVGVTGLSGDDFVDPGAAAVA
ncbi:MAG TPA: calcium-binding protein [Geminicoccaceae bacterium]|nr:calcium-binding protein [Geminicoccaceae bacterium]